MAQTRKMQVAVGGGVLAIGLALAGGAISIPSAAGYGGVGPNFLPWVVAISLIGCGVLIVREALTGGFRAMEEPSGAEHAYWPAFAWVSAGLLATAVVFDIIYLIGNSPVMAAVSYWMIAAGLLGGLLVVVRRTGGRDR